MNLGLIKKQLSLLDLEVTVALKKFKNILLNSSSKINKNIGFNNSEIII